MAPNIKDISTFPRVEGIDIINSLDSIIPSLTALPMFEEADRAAVEQFLKKSKNLEQIYWQYGKNISNLEPILSVKTLEVYEYEYVNLLRNCNEWSRVFPSITELIHEPQDGDEDDIQYLFNLLREGKWPNLKYISGLSSETIQDIREIRPNICVKNDNEDMEEFIKNYTSQDEILEFETHWLILDGMEFDFINSMPSIL